MNFWKRLRWMASAALALVLLIAFALAVAHRLSAEEAGPEDASGALRIHPPVPMQSKGQPTHNSTGL